MNPCEQALQWAVQYLVSHEESSIVNHQKIAQTSYSVVFKIETTKNIVYLKQTPKELFLEPEMLYFLNKHGCRNVPELLAENNELHCFIMTSCGDSSLRHLFKGQVDFNKLKIGI